MLRWTADNRPLVWIVTPGTTDLYSLYVNGWLYLSHMKFDEFYPLYRQFSDGIRAAAMQDFMIVSMYLFVGLTIASGAAALYLLANGAFYVFCWCFCKIDSYLQERYWKQLQNTIKFNNNYKDVA